MVLQETARIMPENDQERDSQLMFVLEGLGVSPDIEHQGFRQGSFLHEACSLPSTERLNGLAQHSPVLNRLLGLEITRGQHTADCMQVAAEVFSQMAINSPALFDELTEEYQRLLKLDSADLLEIKDLRLAKRVLVIQHLIEYLRLHDLLTLPFHGALHGAVVYHGEKYNEDGVLSRVHSGELTGTEVAALVENQPTQDFYNNHHIDGEVVRLITERAINGCSDLIQLLKGKGSAGQRIVSIDMLAYIVRVACELGRISDLPHDAPLLDRLEGVYETVNAVSDALAQDKGINITVRDVSILSREELIPPNLVRLGVWNGGHRFIYNGSVVLLYLAHVLSRLYVSGSPLVRGTNRIIRNHYLNCPDQEEDLVARLLQNNEDNLTMTDLRDVLPISNLTPAALADPRLLPSQVKGWQYSSTESEAYPGSVTFQVKPIQDTIVETEEKGIAPIFQHFPQLIERVRELENMSSPYLQQRIFSR